MTLSLVSQWPSFQVSFNLSQGPFLSWESMQHPCPPCSVLYELDTFVSIIIQSLDCWVRFTCNRVFSSFLRQWHPDWLEKLVEDLRFDGWYHAIPCDTPRFSMAEVLSSCSLSSEGRSDGVPDLMTSMHVLLEHEGATRNLNGEVKLSSVPKIMAWFPYDFHIFQWCSLRSQHDRSSSELPLWAQAAPKQRFGDCDWSNAFNQRAGVPFGWYDILIGRVITLVVFSKPRLKVNPVDLSCRFFRCTWG